MAEEIQHLMHQISLMENQLKSIDQTIKKLDPGQYKWSDAQGVINDLGNTITKANGLSYSASNINEQFKEHYPGYQSSENYSESYKAMTHKTQNTLNGVLQSMG